MGFYFNKSSSKIQFKKDLCSSDSALSKVTQERPRFMVEDKGHFGSELKVTSITCTNRECKMRSGVGENIF